MGSGRSSPEPADFPARPAPPLPLGASECLLGSAVRYDGSDARRAFPHRELAGLYTFRGICPEVGVGMGVPRPPIHLEERAGRIRVVGREPARADFTDALEAFAGEQAGALADVAGYVLMRGSPSCGLRDVKVFPAGGGGGTGVPERRGRGAYAAELGRRLPLLPMEETGRLDDPALRESFVARTFVYAHWQALARQGVTRRRLLAFHRRHRCLLLAHSVPACQAANALLGKAADPAAQGNEYVALLLGALARPASRAGYALVFAHLQHRARALLPSGERRELGRAVRSFQRLRMPTEAVRALFRSCLQPFPEIYAVYESCLDPYPALSSPRIPAGSAAGRAGSSAPWHPSAPGGNRPP